jgi:hypothetical protein
VELSELLERLAELAREAGLVVRETRAGGEGELASGTCRVRGELWVVLAGGDTLEQRVEVLARALNLHAAQVLEDRYLPPAVRERLAKAAAAG